MPTASVQTLPTDVVRAIAAFLPIPMLESLRLTCRKIEHDIYEDFLRRGYRSKTLIVSKVRPRVVDSYMHVLRNQQLASTLRVLNIEEYRPTTTKDGEMVRLMAKLPNLAQLRLQGFISASLRLYLPLPDLAMAVSKVRTLRLSSASLTKKELLSFLTAFTGRAKDSQMEEVNVTTDDWHTIFQAVRSLGLMRLEYGKLVSGRFRRVFTQDEGTRVNKGRRGPTVLSTTTFRNVQLTCRVRWRSKWGLRWCWTISLATR